MAKLVSTKIKTGVTQKELGARINMKQPQIAKIERMHTLPSFSTLTRYAAALDLSIKMTVESIIK
ncbi:helix-turn-helix domain-containing protein [Paucilactobacillus nenjiangensis]|uniref:helix-turn-helix domain-containing protein n=1 Tax=Paucilactobacillus nenjiangensis TaxID=1296540 RepID=UPI001CDC7DA5|nr:helix-turn-helix transcriptional regulator [Paucilactobacillus nenjiangensis]